jgi:hypothetical protein
LEHGNRRCEVRGFAGFSRPRRYDVIGMKKDELARRLAAESGKSKAQAADQVDAAVYQILRNFRSGKPGGVLGISVVVPARDTRKKGGRRRGR